MLRPVAPRVHEGPGGLKPLDAPGAAFDSDPAVPGAAHGRRSSSPRSSWSRWPCFPPRPPSVPPIQLSDPTVTPDQRHHHDHDHLHGHLPPQRQARAGLRARPRRDHRPQHDVGHRRHQLEAWRGVPGHGHAAGRHVDTLVRGGGSQRCLRQGDRNRIGDDRRHADADPEADARANPEAHPGADGEADAARRRRRRRRRPPPGRPRARQRSRRPCRRRSRHRHPPPGRPRARRRSRHPCRLPPPGRPRARRPRPGYPTTHRDPQADPEGDPEADPQADGGAPGDDGPDPHRNRRPDRDPRAHGRRRHEAHAHAVRRRPGGRSLRARGQPRAHRLHRARRRRRGARFRRPRPGRLRRLRRELRRVGRRAGRGPCQRQRSGPREGPRRTHAGRPGHASCCPSSSLAAGADGDGHGLPGVREAPPRRPAHRLRRGACGKRGHGSRVRAHPELRRPRRSRVPAAAAAAVAAMQTVVGPRPGARDRRAHAALAPPVPDGGPQGRPDPLRSPPTPSSPSTGARAPRSWASSVAGSATAWSASSTRPTRSAAWRSAASTRATRSCSWRSAARTGGSCARTAGEGWLHKMTLGDVVIDTAGGGRQLDVRRRRPGRRAGSRTSCAPITSRARQFSARPEPPSRRGATGPLAARAASAAPRCAGARCSARTSAGSRTAAAASPPGTRRCRPWAPARAARARREVRRREQVATAPGRRPARSARRNGPACSTRWTSPRTPPIASRKAA